MARPKQELTQVHLKLPTHVLERIDAFAAANGINRTAAVVWLCASALAAEEKKRA